MTTKYHDETYTAKCSEKTLQSNERGFFMQFVEHVVQNVGEDWIENVFGKLKEDKERVRIIYEFEQVSKKGLVLSVFQLGMRMFN